MNIDAITRRKPATRWDEFRASPLPFIARSLYAKIHPISDPKSKTIVLGPRSDGVSVVCMADTHNAHEFLSPVPEGDILVHAGDLTYSGTVEELNAVLAWLNSLPHTHKFVIAGNHDTALEDRNSRERALANYPGLTYLQDSSATVQVRGRELTVYGSPQTPRHGTGAFQYPRISYSAAAASPVWENVPRCVDILITHGPPAHHLDIQGIGCLGLLSVLWRVKPRLHVFGHVHAGRGVQRVGWTKPQSTYERVVAGKGGRLDLPYLALVVLGRRCVSLWLFFATTMASDSGDTILVNAAAKGGFRDEQLRDAIVVHI
ncbi:hypothetical protein M0805_003724 [Coniferiporia weirii]|nr:hypothetical protein M0805_003724 [Coniferiporia weirii]